MLLCLYTRWIARKERGPALKLAMMLGGRHSCGIGYAGLGVPISPLLKKGRLMNEKTYGDVMLGLGYGLDATFPACTDARIFRTKF